MSRDRSSVNAAMRCAGVSVPLFSLRSERDGGIGDFTDLVAFIDWAAGFGQRLVALLPLCEMGPGETSPYHPLSSFALDPIFLRPQELVELRGEHCALMPSRDCVDHFAVRASKAPLFEEAFRRFRAFPSEHPRRRRFARFRAAAQSWLADYALFRALLDEQGARSWTHWPDALRRRDPGALEEARRRLAERIAFFEFLQFAAAEAWRETRVEAERRGVVLMGDLSFAPSQNSVDVWANPGLFDLSRSVGAPPDAFSASGQRWGLPMYRWDEIRRSGWRWFRARARRMAELYDLFRVDHVVGLFRTFWFDGETPGGFDPPVEAEQITQGREILRLLVEGARPATIVAEDLGTIPEFVLDMLGALDVPGYKVLRWQRDDGGFIDPAAYPECSIATTGTHDTDSLTEWWEGLAPAERTAVIGSAEASADPELTRAHRLAILERLYRSPSRYVIFPIQDLFGWRERINTPATVGVGNWVYRLPAPLERLRADPAVVADVAALRTLIDRSGRLRRIDLNTSGPQRARAREDGWGKLGGAMEEFKTGSVRANGLQFHFLEAGRGPLVLCLHGFPDHARSFRSQLPALAKAGFRAVAPYLRGYAPTDVPPNGPFQAAALATDAAALVEALSPSEPAFVFGHDWGALAAYGAAQLAPRRIRKIATAAVPHGPQLLQAIVSSYDQMRRSWYIFMFQMPTAEAAVSGAGFAFLDRMWADWSPGWTVPAEEMAALKETFRKAGVLPAALGYYRHTFNPALQVPELAELQSKMMTAPIPVPALVFHGRRDGCIGVETLEGMEALCPQGLAKVVIEDAGHFVHQERPDRVNEALIAFFKA
ncbi:MAG: 4-alpha-glucanotransferase [Candidatus Binatia bacterium]